MLESPARALVPAVFAVGCLWLSGCTSSESDDAGALSTASSAGSVALLQIERSVDADGSGSRVVAGTKVARFKGLDGDALVRLLGAKPLELETCELSGGLSTEPVSLDAQVELLSVGDISLRNATVETTLVPRLFPALSTTAVGWFYATDTELPAPRAELDEYVASAPGEQGLGAFEAVLVAPAELTALEVRGVALERLNAVRRDEQFTLNWEADDPRDWIEVELLSGGSVLSCAARDDGQLTISTAHLAMLEPDENATLVVRRVRGTSFDMQGIEASYARVATTRSAVLSVH